MKESTHSLVALSRWLDSDESMATRRRAPALLDESSWVLERDRSGRAIARVQTHDQTTAVLAPSAEGWDWLGPEDDTMLPVGRWISDSRRAAHALADLIDGIEELICVAHRPQRRMVLAVMGNAGSNARRLYAKGLRRSAFRRAHDLHVHLLGSELQDLLCLPSLLIESELALVYPAARGTTLHDMGRKFRVPEVSGLSRALDRFWNASGPWQRSLPERSLEDERSSTVSMLRRASELDPSLAPLAKIIAELTLPPPSGPRGLVHGDLHDRQILVGPSGVKIIDLDTVARGPVWIDVVNLREHTALRVQQGLCSGEWARAVEQSIRHAIGDPVEPAEAEILRVLVRARLLAVYSLRPAWKGVVRWLRRRLYPSTLRLG